ncbi:protein Daple-like [Eptesicus fuscus]|uniref:protein Daple-like n=1 Tax=Eptesicus fuscus TaxID=29078 RepID=UPI002403E774|nr:protein Daple-like [Eptesicus fuscus]
MELQEPGHIPQQFLEELLGDNMALEADQGQKMDHPAHRRMELGQLSEASGRILALEGNHETLQGAVREPQGDSLALREGSGTCTELQKETQQLREQVEELGIQLRNEKPTSQHLSALKGQLLKLIDTLRLYRAQQQEAEEEQREELREQQKQRTEVQEALLQEQEAKARVTEENERLRQEVARLTSWTEQLQGEQEELRTQNRELQASLRNEQQNFRICQNLYHEMMAEQRSKEISLTKMSVQCESLTRLRKDLEEERRHLWSQIDTLKELNQSLLEARAGTWTPHM